jgi:hypothetical protein
MFGFSLKPLGLGSKLFIKKEDPPILGLVDIFKK